jgi:hypothetical protein
LLSEKEQQPDPVSMEVRSLLIRNGKVNRLCFALERGQLDDRSREMEGGNAACGE